MPSLDRFMTGLDRVQPKWYLSFATTSELKQFALLCIESGGENENYLNQLREDVATRLVAVAEAAFIA